MRGQSQQSKRISNTRFPRPGLPQIGALLIGTLVLFLLGLGATGAAETDEVETETPEYIEVMWRGKSYRIALSASQSGVLQVEEGELELQFRTPEEARASAGERSGAVETNADDSAAETSGVFSGTTLLLLGILGTVVLLLLGYFGVVDPLRRQWPMREALKILHADRRTLFGRAEELLAQALLAGLRKGDIARARFALAYVRARLGRYEEASTVLGELEKSGATIDQPTAYLLLRVQSQLKNHERVERIANQYADLLKGTRDLPLILSISYLALARIKWARREINGAMHYFDLIRELEVLADEIPNHIDNHEVVTGTVALFEKNIDEAEKHFEAAVKAADQHGKPIYPGRLGLLLCRWKRNDMSRIDEDLAEVLHQMQPEESSADSPTLKTACPHCGQSYRVRGRDEGRKVKCRACQQRFVVESLNTGEIDQPETIERIGQTTGNLMGEDELLLRNARLWHCVTLLVSWLEREPKTGLQEDDLRQFSLRFFAVLKVDSEMGDPYLLSGLIRYYFSETSQQRQIARAELEKAVDKDVHVPEVLQLLDRESKLATLAENSLVYFHQLAQQYAENMEVDSELRDRFLHRMTRFERFRSMGEIQPATSGDNIAPSVENLQNRGHILRTRVSNIVRYKLEDADPEAREEIHASLSELEARGISLSENARAFQETELGLLQSTGEFLFQDETPFDQPSQPSGEENGRPD